MEIVYNDAELRPLHGTCGRCKSRTPSFSRPLPHRKEVEVDAICDGETTVIPGIMEHIERAGVHSGDSIAVYPPQTLTPDQIATLEDYTKRLAKG